MALNPVEACLRRSPVIKQLHSAHLDTRRLNADEGSFNFCKNGKYIYHYGNDTVHVYSMHNGHYIGGHKFDGRIVSVGSMAHSDLLFIGTEHSSAAGGQLCVFNSALSLILKTIKLPSVPLRIMPLFLSKTVPDEHAWHPDLLKFDGAVVIACYDIIYLIDLHLTNQNQSSSILTDIELLPSVVNCEEIRSDIRAAGMTIAVKIKYQIESIEVTSLSCSSRTSLLLIGMANGQMVFYCLKEMRPVWCYDNSDDEFGVVKNIFIQEPENDPRKTCWIWQCAQKDNVVQLELYSLEFIRRDVYKLTEKTRRTQYSGLRQGVFLYHLSIL